MSEPLTSITIERPTTVIQAVALLTANPKARLHAGGTDLIVNMRHGLVDVDTLVDLTGIADRQQITQDENGMQIGAGVILRALIENEEVTASYPVIQEAALSIAGPTHREAATVGGNLCLDTRCYYYNQSHWWRKSNDYCLKYRGDICHVAPKGDRCRAAFSGDLAPALIALGAEAEIAGPKGNRLIPVEELYLEDGAEHLTLKPDEILVAVHLPRSPSKSTYGKIRVRGSIDFPLAGVAVASAELSDGAVQFSVAVTGTNSMPIKVPGIEPFAKTDDPDAYFTNLGKLVQKAVSPQRTTTIAPNYRRLSISALASRLARGLV